MQFMKSTTTTLVVFFFALPALVASSKSSGAQAALPYSSSPSFDKAAPGLPVAIPTKEQAQKIARGLKIFASTIETELRQCVNEPGNDAADCFNRANVMDLPKGKIIIQAEIDAATLQYSKLVGKLLGDCSKTEGFYNCLDLIERADDKEELAFTKRSLANDYISGLIQDFTGTFHAAIPIMEMVSPYIKRNAAEYRSTTLYLLVAEKLSNLQSQH